MRKQVHDINRAKDQEESSRVKSYTAENEALKKQMFNIDKSLRNMEAELADEQDKTARLKKDNDAIKKKLQDTNAEKL